MFNLISGFGADYREKKVITSRYHAPVRVTGFGAFLTDGGELFEVQAGTGLTQQV